jgi:hypothetical protein
MEIRYIVFTPDEVRAAIIAFLQRQSHGFKANDVVGVDVVGPNETPAAVMRLRGAPSTEPINLDTQRLIAALLLYCVDRRIPVPKQAEKKAELSINGLTLILTTDRRKGSPQVAHNQVSYGEIMNRATQTIGTIREELARTVARANHAEGMIAQANDRADKAEADRAQSSATLVAITIMPGLRGRLGRWLLRLKTPA